MSSKQTTVAFKFDFSQSEKGGSQNSIGPATPTNFTAGNHYTFNFQNNTTATSFNYDISSLTFSTITGSETGTVSPGQTATVSIFWGTPVAMVPMKMLPPSPSKWELHHW